MISPDERAALDRGDFKAALRAYERSNQTGVCMDLRVRKRRKIVIPERILPERKARKASLSEEAVREIRRSLVPDSQIAKAFGIAKSTVWRIRNYESYRWVS